MESEVIGMDMKYKILPLENEQKYIYLIILCNSHSPYDYIDDISKKLDATKPGTILIDQILHVGNTEKRFMAFQFNGNKIENGDFVNIKKDSSLRKLTCNFLNNTGLVDSSTLTSIQSRMIKKGLVI